MVLVRWVYQERDGMEPWALCIEKEWHRHKPRDAIYTLRLFSEAVDNSSHCFELAKKGLDKKEALAWFAAQLAEMYGEADERDLEQLDEVLTNLNL